MSASKLWKCILMNRWFKLWSMYFYIYKHRCTVFSASQLLTNKMSVIPCEDNFESHASGKFIYKTWVILLSFSNISICFTLPKFLLITMETYAKEIKMKRERGERRREGEEASFWNLGKECKRRNKNEMIRRWREERMEKKRLFVNVWCQFTLPLSNFFLLCFLSWSNVTLQK